MTYRLEITFPDYEVLTELDFDTLEQAYQHVERFAAKRRCYVEWYTQYHAIIFRDGYHRRVNISCN